MGFILIRSTEVSIDVFHPILILLKAATQKLTSSLLFLQFGFYTNHKAVIISWEELLHGEIYL